MLRELFGALRRFTKAVNESASLFESANDSLRDRLAVDDEDRPAALEHNKQIANGSGRKLARSNRS